VIQVYLFTSPLHATELIIAVMNSDFNDLKF